MKRLLLTAGACVASAALAANGNLDWFEQYRPLHATYLIYAGEPGERSAPSKTDRKIAIIVTGDPAKDIFNSLYPDATGVSCTSEQGERLRRKGDIWCSYRPSEGYKCFLGYNLRTGQPHSGASC